MRFQTPRGEFDAAFIIDLRYAMSDSRDFAQKVVNLFYSNPPTLTATTVHWETETLGDIPRWARNE